MINPVNTYYYNNAPSFNGFGANKGKKLTDSEKMHNFVRYTIGKLNERSEREIPEYGHFSPLVYLFPIPGTQNEAIFTIKHNFGADKKQRVLETAVRRQNTDREISNIVVVGTKKEIEEKLALMKDKEDEVIENIARLSKKVDDFYLGNKE